MRIIEFIPPVYGLDGEFNTFRFGLFYFKHLVPGEVVALVDAKDKLILGHAEFKLCNVGPFADMLDQFACFNHTQLRMCPEKARDNLKQVMSKIYGPHIATDNRRTTVVHLRRIKYDG